MNEQNIQHPDITAAERTGYPYKAPRKVTVEITDEVVRKYIDSDTADFISFCMMRQDVIDDYLRSTEEYFETWCKETLIG